MTARRACPRSFLLGQDPIWSGGRSVSKIHRKPLPPSPLRAAIRPRECTFNGREAAVAFDPPELSRLQSCLLPLPNRAHSFLHEIQLARLGKG